MSSLPRLLLVAVLAVPGTVLAQETPGQEVHQETAAQEAEAEKTAWEFDASLWGYFPPDDRHYAQPTVISYPGATPLVSPKTPPAISVASRRSFSPAPTFQPTHAEPVFHPS